MALVPSVKLGRPTVFSVAITLRVMSPASDGMLTGCRYRSWAQEVPAALPRGALYPHHRRQNQGN
ncbi:MAG TPA: hypothetical protein VGI40_16310 [Pirellulaceae bacterium]